MGGQVTRTTGEWVVVLVGRRVAVVCAGYIFIYFVSANIVSDLNENFSGQKSAIWSQSRPPNPGSQSTLDEDEPMVLW